MRTTNQAETGTANRSGVYDATDEAKHYEGMTMTKKPTSRVVLTSGEELEMTSKMMDNGVMTDAGLICWNQIEGFKHWVNSRKTWIFTPVS